MTEQTSIACLLRAEVALNDASSILVVKELLDQGAAVSVWAERHGIAAGNRARLDRFILNAERRLGQLLATSDVRAGRPPKDNGDAALPLSGRVFPGGQSGPTEKPRRLCRQIYGRTRGGPYYD
jgi:hypothetical protein